MLTLLLCRIKPSQQMFIARHELRNTATLWLSATMPTRAASFICTADIKSLDLETFSAGTVAGVVKSGNIKGFTTNYIEYTTVRLDFSRACGLVFSLYSLIFTIAIRCAVPQVYLFTVAYK